jgi:Flp pilus assembly protein TadD
LVVNEYKRRLRNARFSAVLAWSMFFMLLVHRWMQDRPAVPRSPERIAVFPFTVSGAAESQYLANGLVDLIATSLDGAGSIRGVDPRALLQWLANNQLTAPTPREAAAVANRFGAGRFVLGTVAGSGSRLRILASLYRDNLPDSAIGSAAIEGEATDLFRLVDQLTSQLLAASLGEARHRLMQVAALTTPSLPALKHYLAGEQDLRAGRYLEAADAFQRAVQVDTGFALAYYRLALAADWLGRDSLARTAGEKALQRAERLSEHDSLLVDAAVTARRGDLLTAERSYRRIVSDYPDDVEAWSQLGDLLFHANPHRGRSVVEARESFTRSLALDPDDAEALMHLARIAYLEGDSIAVDSLARRLTRGAARSEVLELRAFRAFALSDRDSWKSVTRELLNTPPDVAPVTALQVALFLDDVDGTEVFARMLTNARYSDDVRGLGYRLIARTLATRGRWQDARIQLDAAERFDRVATLELRSLLASLTPLDVPLAEVRAIRNDVERWTVSADDDRDERHSASHAGLHEGVRAYRLGLLSARLNEQNAVEAQADSLDRQASRARGRTAYVLSTMSHSLRARVAFARGDAEETLRQLDQATWLPIESGFEEEAGDRYLRGEALMLLGRHAEARNWFRTIAERGMHELVYIAPSRLREALLACELDDRAGAAAAHAIAARLWSESAQPLQENMRRTEELLRARGVTLSVGARR